MAKRRGAADPGRRFVAEAPGVERVMEAAARHGLLAARTGRISGRVSPALVAQAKRRTGLTSDSDLIAFALANIALEDRFIAVFKATLGTVDPDLDLDF